MALKDRYIPSNVLQSKRLFGIRKRNLFEGVLWGFVLMMCLGNIPFVPKARAIINTGCLICMILFNIVGIKGLTFTQVITAMYFYRRYLKDYHYRPLNYAKKPKELFEEKKDGTIIVTTVKENEMISKAYNLFSFNE